MVQNSKIEWTDHTFNAWVGCQEVSPACDHCYARTQNAHRNWVKGWGPHGERRRTTSVWRDPYKWEWLAAAAGERHRVFVNSLSDFCDNKAPQEWRNDVMQITRECPHLDFLLLTKRPQNYREMLPGDFTAEHYPNVWLGTTVENQEEAERRVPNLIEIPARVHFLSCEPLLGPVNVARWLGRRAPERHKGTDWDWMGVNWVICGGEANSVESRPMHPDWARSLRDQCVAAGVPFLFKQWGDHIDIDGPRGVASGGCAGDRRSSDFYFSVLGKRPTGLIGTSAYANSVMRRVGKKAAGRELDGRTWDQFPESS